jgi:hypothetical protein
MYGDAENDSMHAPDLSKSFGDVAITLKRQSAQHVVRQRLSARFNEGDVQSVAI